jgi:methylaspartate ammonia-lyase
MRITNVFASPGLTGFYFDDLEAIRRGAKMDGALFIGAPVTPGFSEIRQRGESVSIMLELEDGQIAVGDCAAVQYSGIAGRDPVFTAGGLMPVISDFLVPRLLGLELRDFKPVCEWVDGLESSGERLHTAIRYGVTQALLDAFSKAERRTMAEVIADAYGLRVSREMIPLFSQSGGERYANVDKMILKGVKVLPHGLINSPELVGADGRRLQEYVEWVRGRIIKLGGVDYRATILLGLYGTLGGVFDGDLGAIAKYLHALEKAAAPFPLWVETPLLAEDREGQIEQSRSLMAHLRNSGSRVKLVADEWCTSLEDVKTFCDEEATDIINIMTPQLGGINNAVEAVLYCKKSGVGAYIAGSCNETDISARVSANLALATRADLVAAKPGMGVDEGIMIIHNEMQRTLATIASRTFHEHDGA